MTIAKFPLATAVEHAVQTVPGVAGLYSGVVGEFATYGQGDRVKGVRVWTADDGSYGRVEVRIAAAFDVLIADPSATLLDLGQQVLSTAADTVSDAVGYPVAVDVRISDVVRGVHDEQERS